MYFEGPEKKVELVVAPACKPLRSFGLARWKAVVAKSQSKILSAIHNESCDAYLLSESSLFVYDDRVLMFTCGRTTLAEAVLEMLEFIAPEHILSLIYERKNEHFPHYQPSNFFADARILHERLPGRAFRFGAQDGHHINLFHLDRPYQPPAEDRTLEVLMHGIGDKARDLFCSGSGRERIQDRFGIREFYPDFQVDDHLFDPMGYSLNAIRGKKYYSIHVTPEATGSYVSFETNARLDKHALEDTLRRILALFEPQSFDLVLFQYPDHPAGWKSLGYQLKGEVAKTLSCGYGVSFQQYFKPLASPVEAFEFKLEGVPALRGNGAPRRRKISAR